MPKEYDEQVAKLLQHIRISLPALGNATLSDEDYYASLPLCVIDAVFSIGVRYEGTRRVVSNWCDAQTPHWTRIDNSRSPERARHGRTISDFLHVARAKVRTYWRIFLFNKNRQRTSARGRSILKAEAVRQFASILLSHGIETFSDLNDEQRVQAAKDEILQIPGQRSGLSFDYFLMLSGSDETVKPDRMICRFVAHALGVDFGSVRHGSWADCRSVQQT